MTIEEVYAALNADDFNISILGGEPLVQYPAILELCRLIKERTDKTIWMWTGYEMAQIQSLFSDLMKYVDVIVDGVFKENLRDTALPFRGSKNQRIYEITHDPEICVTDISDRFD
jgi:anaerobic ribonucleoside-triphosphate reductase activating protein